MFDAQRIAHATNTGLEAVYRAEAGGRDARQAVHVALRSACDLVTQLVGDDDFYDLYASTVAGAQREDILEVLSNRARFKRFLDAEERLLAVAGLNERISKRLIDDIRLQYQTIEQIPDPALMRRTVEGLRVYVCAQGKKTLRAIREQGHTEKRTGLKWSIGGLAITALNQALMLLSYGNPALALQLSASPSLGYTVFGAALPKLEGDE